MAADEIVLLDLAAMRVRTTIKGALGPISSLTFSPDGKTLASVGQPDRSGLGGLVLWDATTWQRPTHIIGNASLVALTPVGSSLISAGMMTSEGFESTFQKLSQGQSPGSDFGKALANVLGTAISGNTRRCVVWDLDGAKPRTSFAAANVLVSVLAMSADGRRVACCGNAGDPVRVWDLATATQQATFDWQGTVTSLAFSPDGETLAIGGLVWNGLESLLKGEGLKGAQGRLPGEVQLWDLEKHEQRCVLRGHRELVSTVCFSPNGQLLATGSGKVEATNNEDTAGQIKLWDVGRGEELFTLDGHPSATTCVAFSPDGTTLATASGHLRSPLTTRGEVRLWDMRTREPKFVLKEFEGGVQCLVFSPDGRTLVTGSAGLVGEVKLWQVATAQGMLSFKVPVVEVVSLSFSSDGQTLAAGTMYGPVVLWHAYPNAR
jgi:WD40 repeat protein